MTSAAGTQGTVDPTAAFNKDVHELVMNVAAEPIKVDELARQLEATIGK